MFTLILAGFALAMDAFAVSVSSGMCVTGLTFAYAVRTAFMFGLFQFLMPLIGYVAGSAFTAVIATWDHWLAFGLLLVVGGKMMHAALRMDNGASCSDDERHRHNVLNLRVLLVLSVATSIDALAVGITYSVIRAPIWLAASIIGSVTFVLCLLGCEFGRRIGTRHERWAELGGGIVLIGIGCKILIEHLIKA